VSLAGVLVLAVAVVLPTAAAQAAPDAIVDDPPGAVGTVLLVHASGWAGYYDDPYYHDAKREIYEFIGHDLAAHHWRVVSIEYAAGEAGLTSVENAVRREHAAHPDQPLCLYGESSGAHLSLLAAANIPQVNCVIAVGAPTNLATWGDPKAEPNLPDNVRQTIAAIKGKVFGPDPAALAAWSPATQARRIRADILLAHETDDWIVPADQVGALRAHLPTAGAYTIPGAPPDAPATTERVHGHWTLQDRTNLIAAVVHTLDRAHTAFITARYAKATGCARANSSAITLTATQLNRAVACLTNAYRTHHGLSAGIIAAAPVAHLAATTPTLANTTGTVTPARILWRLAQTTAGRHVLQRPRAHELTVAIRYGQRSALHLRIR
jgi:dienelactone hydrolase